MAQAARLQVYRLAFLEHQLAVARDEEKGIAGQCWPPSSDALDLGYVTIINLAAAQASLQKVHLRVLTIEQQREQERLALNQALGLPPEQQVPLRRGWSLLPPRRCHPSRKSAGIWRRGGWISWPSKWGIRARKNTSGRPSWPKVPNINIGFAHASDTTHVITTGLAITIDLPIFDRRQGRIAIETATRQQLFDEYVSRLFAARADVARLLADMASLRRQIRSTQEAIPTLSNLVQTYYHALLEGNADVISYYNARDEQISRQIDLLTLKRNLADQRIALEIAAGEYLGDGTNKAVPQ